MSSIINMWEKNKELFKTKNISQIISFIGNGKLTDSSQTSIEFRGLLNIIPSNILMLWANECLEEKFENSGLVLQDIVNQIGIRLGFEVDFGVYRGRRNIIGYDGIWKTREDFNIIIEVKTTDAYRINLDNLHKYRKKLIQNNTISMDNSSILIIVGRQDTGDLEAQIRGSRHAWDIRLVSTDALIDLLVLKEKLNDTKTLFQVNSVLKPMEYTKLDKLINLIFKTAEDLELDDDIDLPYVEDDKKETKARENPVSFHDECVAKIEKSFELSFHKQSRTAYLSRGKNTGMTLSISKVHSGGSHDAKYWFAFHPHQKEFLVNLEISYVAFGCGSSNNLFLINFTMFKEQLEYMWTTESEKRMYWHVVIYQDGDDFTLQIPKQNEFIDLSKYKVV